METRDVVDYQGNVLGQLSMPEGTSEEAWAHALSPYAKPPVVPTLAQVISSKLQSASDFGAQIIFDAKVGNVAQGITQAGKTKEVSDYLHDIGRYLNEGSLYAAVAALEEMALAEIPQNVQPFVTAERLTATKNKIQDFLGIPRT